MRHHGRSADKARRMEQKGAVSAKPIWLNLAHRVRLTRPKGHARHDLPTYLAPARRGIPGQRGLFKRARRLSALHGATGRSKACAERQNTYRRRRQFLSTLNALLAKLGRRTWQSSDIGLIPPPNRHYYSSCSKPRFNTLLAPR